MNLQAIETAVLRIIGADYYADLSTSTDPGKIEDFAMLHRCVNLARDDMRMFCTIGSILKSASTITTVSGTKQYLISDTDFDLPKKVFYTNSEGKVAKLTKVTSENILQYVDNFTTAGVPIVYRIFGSSGVSPYIEVYNVPNEVGSIDIEYSPVLADFSTATDEDVLMSRFSSTLIMLASAYAFQMLKKDDKNFDKWLALGRANYRFINFAENGADNNEIQTVDDFLSKVRKDRRTI